MEKKKLKVIFLVLICFMIGTSQPDSVNAYELTGYHWPSGNISFWLDPKMDDNFLDAYYSAEEYWTGLSNVNLTEKTLQASADIKCYQETRKNVHWDGWTDWYYNGSGYLTSATIILNDWWGYEGDEHIRYIGVAGHEFGHALGLEHHEGPYIMTEWQAQRWDTYGIYFPQKDDIEGVNSLYTKAHSADLSLDGADHFNGELNRKAAVSWAVKFNNIKEITNASDVIALVEIGDKKKEYTAGRVPFTVFEAEIVNLIAGDINNMEHIFITMNGIDNATESIEVIDDPLMHKGEKYLLFLEKSDDNDFIIVGGPAGRLVYDDRTDTVTSLKLVQTSEITTKSSSSFLVNSREVSSLSSQINAIVNNDEEWRGTGSSGSKAILTEEDLPDNKGYLIED